MRTGIRLAAALAFAVIITVVVCSAFVPAPSSAAIGAYEVIIQDEIRLDPGADYWWIPFDVVGPQVPATCRLVSVTLDGADVMDAVDSATTVFVNELHLPKGQFADWTGLRSAVSRSAEEQSKLDALNMLVEKELARRSHSSLRLSPSKLGVVTDEVYRLRVTLQVESSEISFVTTLASRTLPGDSYWIPAEIHIHSTWSDGILTPEEHVLNFWPAGYRVFYFTDHVSGLRPPGQPNRWGDYTEHLAWLTTEYQTNPGIYLYAGAEVTTTSPTGDSIALGIGSLGDLYDGAYYPQVVINKINTVCGGTYPMAAIAHPYNAFIPWTDWTVTNYHGYEIMSGYQSNSSNTSSEANKWRTELYRNINQTITGSGRFPAALASTDYHRLSHPGQVTWLKTNGLTSKSAVDGAIWNGKTVASKKGGLAIFTLTANGQSSEIGEKRRNVPANTPLTANVTFRPAVSGTYSLAIYRGISSTDSTPVLCWSRNSVSVQAGQTYQWPSESLFASSFPGGRHCYYLYVFSSGAGEYIFSSPIFLSSN